MTINFAKIAADLDTNPKVRRAGRNAREVFAFVLRRVALARAQGRIPVSNVEPWYLADQLMMTEAEAEEGISRACMPFRDGPGLLAIDGDDVVVCGWDDEWGRYPLTEGERKEKQRAAEKQKQKEKSKPREPEADQRRLFLVPPPDQPSCPDTSRDVRTVTDQIRSEEKRSETVCENANVRVQLDREPHTHTTFDPDSWEPEADESSQRAAREAAERGVLVEYELKKYRAHIRKKRWSRRDANDEWASWLLKAHPTHANVRDAMSRVQREHGSRAALDRERREADERKQRAEADRKEVQRAARAALANGFQMENATK